MLLTVLLVLTTNIIVGFAVGILCYNAGWQEAFEFCTAAHVQAIEDIQKEGH